MFLKRAWEAFKRDSVAELREEVEDLREEVEDLREEVAEMKKAEELRGSYVNEDGDRVPMSQVLNEYLYGKEENK